MVVRILRYNIVLYTGQNKLIQSENIKGIQIDNTQEQFIETFNNLQIFSLAIKTQRLKDISKDLQGFLRHTSSSLY